MRPGSIFIHIYAHLDDPVPADLDERQNRGRVKTSGARQNDQLDNVVAPSCS